eukprot:scaffold32793_cov69-Phaeocystis_antarctica.AAC.5
MVCEGGSTTHCSGIGMGGPTCAVGQPRPLTLSSVSEALKARHDQSTLGQKSPSQYRAPPLTLPPLPPGSASSPSIRNGSSPPSTGMWHEARSTCASSAREPKREITSGHSSGTIQPSCTRVSSTRRRPSAMGAASSGRKCSIALSTHGSMRHGLNLHSGCRSMMKRASSSMLMPVHSAHATSAPPEEPEKLSSSSGR